MPSRSSLFLRNAIAASLLLTPLLLSCGGGKPKVTHNTPDPVIESFSVEPSTLTEGDEATLVPVFREGIGRITAQGKPVMNGNSETVGSGARIKISPKETTTYTLAVTNGNPAADKRQDVAVTVLPKPQEPVIEVERPYVTLGKTIPASVKEQAGCTYQWSVEKNGSIVGDSDKAQVTLSATALGILPVKCVVTNAAGGSTPSSSNLTVVEQPKKPVISISSNKLADIEEGVAKILTIQDDCTYAWSIEGGTLIGANSNYEVRFKPTMDTKKCFIYCEAKNLAGDASQRERAEIEVEPAALSIEKFESPDPRHFDPRKGTTLIAKFTGKGVVNPGNLPIESGVPLVVKPFNPMLYELTVTKKGRSDSRRAAVYPAQILAAGDEHTIARLADGAVRAWGHDQFGQLGNWRPLVNANSTDKTCCIKVLPVIEAGGAFLNATLISAGAKHGMAYKQGKLWAWGWNEIGQLGDGTSSHRSVAAPMNTKEPLNNVRMIAAGYGHNLVLDDSGLLGCGWNGNGQLGSDPKKAIWPEFERLALKDAVTKNDLDTKDVATVSAGARHTVLLKNDGTVYTFGSYDQEQKPDENLKLKAMDTVNAKRVGDLKNIVAIASGHMHALALQNDGTVWAWGDNRRGSLGNGKMPEPSTFPVKVEGLDHVVAIATGYWHSFAMKSDGTIWGWGHNNLAQVDGSLQSVVQPVQFTALTNAVALAMGNEHSVALKSDGTVHTWGSNEYGQSGNYQWIAKTVSLSVQSGDSFYGEGIVTVENLNYGDAAIMMCFHSKDRVLGWSEGIKETPSTPGMPSRMQNGGPLKLANQGTVPAHSDASLEKWAKLYFELPATGGAKATITNIWFNEGSKPNYEGKNLWDMGDIVIEVPKAQIAPLPAAMEVSGSWVPLAL